MSYTEVVIILFPLYKKVTHKKNGIKKSKLQIKGRFICLIQNQFTHFINKKKYVIIIKVGRRM